MFMRMLFHSITINISVFLLTEKESATYPDPKSVMDIQHLKRHPQNSPNACCAPSIA